MKVIELFLEKPRVFVLTILFILISGFFALNSVPRQENPELAQRWANVQVVHPGASPERIETQILEPLEAKLREVYEIRRLDSSASDGFSITLIELKDDVDPSLIEDTWSEVQDKIDQARADLPSEIKTELIRSSGPPATLLYAVKWLGDGSPPKIVMTRVANDLRLELAYGGGTDKALLFGGSEEEVLIEIDNAKISSMGLSFQEISKRIKSMDNKRPIGVFNDENKEILIKSKDNLRTIHEIEDLPIQIFSGSDIIRLGDIADIRKTPRIPSEEIVYVDGYPAILIQVNAAFKQRIDVYAKKLEEIAKAYDSDLPSELSIIKLYDESFYLTEKFDNLSWSIFLATNTVILLSYFLLGLRSALIVGITIPLTVCIVLFGCRLLGLPLHQTSMTGIIIALGLLIDNAIIMVEDYKYRRRVGHSPKNSALISFKNLWIPLAAATATTSTWTNRSTPSRKNIETFFCMVVAAKKLRFPMSTTGAQYSNVCTYLRESSPIWTGVIARRNLPLYAMNWLNMCQPQPARLVRAPVCVPTRAAFMSMIKPYPASPHSRWVKLRPISTN